MNTLRRIHNEIECAFEAEARGGGKNLFVFQCLHAKKPITRSIWPPAPLHDHQLRVGVMITVVTISHAGLNMPYMTFNILNLDYPSRPPGLISVGAGPRSYSSSSSSAAASCSYDSFLRRSVIFMKSMRMRFKTTQKEKEEKEEDEESKCFAEFFRRGCPCCSSRAMNCHWRPVFTLADIYQEFTDIYAMKRRYLAIYWLRKAFYASRETTLPCKLESLLLSFLE